MRAEMAARRPRGARAGRVRLAAPASRPSSCSRELPRPRRLRADRRLASCARARRGALRGDFPRLDVRAGGRRFLAAVRLPPPISRGRTLGFFPGSTIGNFDAAARPSACCAHFARMLVAGGRLIVGVDLKKDATRSSRLQRCGGRHRRVQSQPAGPHQPRARRLLRSRRLPARRRSTIRATAASRCIWSA